MADTVSQSIVQTTWTNISSSLTDGTTYFLQNRGSRNVELVDSSTAPATSRIGYVIHPKDWVYIKPTASSDVYARSESGAGTVVITEST